MLDEKKNKTKRVVAMKNVVPKTKEKPDADYYAIAVAAQGERNQMQDLKRVGSTRIREKHQGAEVGRYCLCRYCDVGYGGQDRTDMHHENYVRQFPGLLENWQAVSLTCTLE